MNWIYDCGKLICLETGTTIKVTNKNQLLFVFNGEKCVIINDVHRNTMGRLIRKLNPLPLEYLPEEEEE